MTSKYGSRLAFASHERVLISGASGWFGRSAIELLRPSGAAILGTAQNARRLNISGEPFQTVTWEQRTIEEFKPTIFLDFAFLTKEKYSPDTHNAYMTANRCLMSNALWAAQLPSITKFVASSSGAAITDREHPYGKLKAEYEDLVRQFSIIAPGKSVIARAWSVSGHLVTKPEVFAFSDLINQAQAGHITVNSQGPVWRRYCDLQEYPFLTIISKVTGTHLEIDSGGELVEILDLADRVKAIVNPRATVNNFRQLATESDRYHSDNLSFSQACASHDFVPMTIDQQIASVSKYQEQLSN